MCGGVQLRVTFPSRFCAHCHCESCRRAHASGFVTWIGFTTDKVTIVAGDALLQAYESSPGTKRTFCRACGTRMTFESAKWPGEIHIPLACFDSAVDRQPAGNAFVDEHVAWITPPEFAHD